MESVTQMISGRCNMIRLNKVRHANVISFTVLDKHLCWCCCCRFDLHVVFWSFWPREDLLFTTHRRVEEFGYSCRQRRLTWAKEKKNWTVAQWSKVLFSDESKFCISFGNQGPRVWRKRGEAHSPSFLKSSVKFPQSVMIWGAMLFAGFSRIWLLHTLPKAPKVG